MPTSRTAPFRRPRLAAVFASALLGLLPISASFAQSIAAGPWSGNVTPTSASVSAALSGSGISARVAASLNADLSNPIYSPSVTSSSTQGNAVRLELANLAANTTYHYAVELNGVLQTSGDLKGTLKTHPTAGARSFKVSFSACGDYNNTSQFVYQAIRQEAPLFFIHMGDMNYQDVNSTNPDNYRAAYTNQLTTGGLRNLVRHVPLAYVWDDHDFSGNDSNKNSTGRTASRQVYRERVPHYPLPAGGPDAAIYQSFTVGRVKFILTDLRSERDSNSLTDNSSKSMMGASQKQWFKNQLLAARDANAPLIVWVSSVPFVSSSASQDNWGSYQTERTELLTFIRDNNVQNLVILSGDMHALAADDGAGTEAYLAGVRIPVFQAAALARGGSVKGGPYTIDGATITPSSGLGRYGNLVINDDGTTLTATYEGRIASGSDTTLSGVSTWLTHTVTTGGSGSAPVVRNPVADTMAQERNPSTNYGTSTRLNAYAKTGWNVESFLRFDVANLGGTVASATLRLCPRTVNGTPTTHRLDLVSNNTWSESSLTWSNRPAGSGSWIRTWTPVLNAYNEIDVTSAVQAASSGLVSFRITSTTGDDIRYGSREEAPAYRPELVITLGSTPPTTTSSYHLYSESGSAFASEGGTIQTNAVTVSTQTSGAPEGSQYLRITDTGHYAGYNFHFANNDANKSSWADATLVFDVRSVSNGSWEIGARDALGVQKRFNLSAYITRNGSWEIATVPLSHFTAHGVNLGRLQKIFFYHPWVSGQALDFDDVLVLDPTP